MATSDHSKISQDAQKIFNSDPSLFLQDKTLTGRGSHSPSMKDNKQSQSVYELWEGVHHGLECQKPIFDDSLQRGGDIDPAFVDFRGSHDRRKAQRLPHHRDLGLNSLCCLFDTTRGL
ncbi:uncharacterized protein AKAW2_51927S [Aspergillus luchuensis]|uniref:Uncharacterized protein n=1 Tax=Aspergillus kawachii TaxID=1069201 RepID=A0A7R8A0W7_ASPKA|nr:uncharacterized protein AKAW2_51927S [Aspergillus luchuensis]BCS01586.1 hypothetical protein AKAW2_51927S [Aspergillus luchuensis]